MKKKIFLIGLLFSVFFFGTKAVQAADISAVSEKIYVSENQTFTLNVNVNTQGIAINNVEGKISFPNDLLNVESVSSNNSIFSMWVETPTFSNTLGTISFNGGIPTPGYTGNKGKIISVIFKAKKAGTANIAFLSANIYANDGLGTNITNARLGTTINISAYQGPETEEEIIVSDTLPASPVILSKEMPDSEEWYSLNKVNFYWSLPEKITAVQLLLGSFPDSIPTITYTPPIREKELNDLSDGIKYIHVRFKNNTGWGKTAHRKIKIDNTAPKNIEVASSVNKEDLLILKIRAEDVTSGINKFKISIDGVFALEEVAQSGKVEILMPAQKPGNHEISIIAYDRAGNIAEKLITEEFPAMKSPEIKEYPVSIKKDTKIEIKGLSYPNTDVKIYLQNERSVPKSYLTKTLEDGSFSFLSDTINRAGLISFWAEAVRGEISSPSSEKYFVQVEKTAFAKLSIQTIQILSVAIPLLILLIILIYIIFHAYHKLNKMRRRIVRDLEETESEAHKIFRILKEDVKQSLKIMKKDEIKNKLSENDNETIETLSKDIKEAEDYFSQRIKKIEKKDL